MLMIQKNGKTTLFLDTRKVSKEQILMIACHERYQVGNIAILVTRSKP